MITDYIVDGSGDFLVDGDGNNIVSITYTAGDFNVQFLKPNGLDADTTYTFTSALTTNSDRLYDRNKNFTVVSVGSDDVTDEVWLFEFGESINITDFFLLEHNAKSFYVEYWTGSAYSVFTLSTKSSNLNGAVTSLLTTEDQADTHFNFSSVATTKIRLTMETTQTTDAQKTVGQVIISEEWGTMVVNPLDVDPSFEQDTSVVNTLSNGGNVFVDYGEKYADTLTFSNTNAADMLVIRNLKKSLSPFFVYPGGGYPNPQEVFRVQDIYYCNYVNPFKPSLRKGLLNLGNDITMRLKEV